MKWLLVGVAFVLGAAITWFLTVKRVNQTMQTAGPDVDDTDEGGTSMGSREGNGVEDVSGDDGTEPEALDDGSDDASRFGGERTEATADPRVGWDHDAEDIDALLSDEEKSGGEKSGQAHRSDDA